MNNPSRTSAAAPVGTAIVRISPQAEPTESVRSAAGLSAQLSELESLPFADPQAALDQATVAEIAANRLGRRDLVMWARLVRGDSMSRLGDMAGGGRISHEVNRWAIEHGDRHLLSRSHQLLAWFYYHLGDTAAQLEHAVHAADRAGENDTLRARCDVMMSLGDALGSNGSHAEARLRLDMAYDMATRLGDIPLQIAVLNNISYGEYWAGEGQAAMDAADRMLALASQHNVPLEFTHLDTVARAQIELGRYAEAEETLLNLPRVRITRRGVEADGGALVLLTLAEAQRLRGATDRARTTLDKCMMECEKRGLAKLRVGVMQERAELLALDGAYREAYEQHKIFYAESEALLSAEREMRARTLHAVFETDEARRDSLRFREMSLRDPLTGLYNRRYVDERLDDLLRMTTASSQPLSVGLIDLDFFKIVNDTLSHAVGDDVLVRVARLLDEAVIEPAFVARLGGEEFLLILPGSPSAEAFSRCESVRRRIGSHDWTELTGDLSITASIGVTTTTDGQSSGSTLLANADSNLYSAKRSGRDRVVGDPA